MAEIRPHTSNVDYEGALELVRGKRKVGLRRTPCPRCRRCVIDAISRVRHISKLKKGRRRIFFYGVV